MVAKVQLDFAARSGSQPFSLELPGEGVDPNPAYLALAASCTALDRCLVDPAAQAVAMLASWAAGAMVKLTHDQLDVLIGQARAYRQACETKGPDFKSTVRYVDMVIQACGDRACRMDAQREQVDEVDGECVPVDFGLWTNVPSLTESFVAQCLRLRMIQQGHGRDVSILEKSRLLLSTLFFVFTNPNPSSLTKSAQATALLALYGADSEITLTEKQYKQLDDEVAEYAKSLDPDNSTGDDQDRPNRVRHYFLVCFIRRLATSRATQDGLRYGVPVAHHLGRAGLA